MTKGNKNKQERIYLDNSASTAVDPRVLKAMEPFWTKTIGNAGSLHEEGRNAKFAVETAREAIAKAIHAQHSETVVFTSGGTESNNLAILGVAKQCILAGKKPNEVHMITGEAEHNSSYDCFEMLERDGFSVTYIPVDADGRLDLEVLKSALQKETVLVSTILVNNEIGTIENVRDVVRLVRSVGASEDQSVYPLVHTDASQAPVWLKVDVQKLGIDLLTLDSQKVYGPKGAGCLFVKHRDAIAPVLYGGGQEFGLRPGTPPTPLIAGFATAMQLLEKERDSYVEKIQKLRDMMFAYVTTKLPDTRINGALGNGRIAGNLNFSFLKVDGEQLVIELDVHGVAISTRSACLSEDVHESRVIHAVHACTPLTEDSGTVRLTLSRRTTKKEIEKAMKILVETVTWLQEQH